MSCSEIRELITGLIDDQISRAERVALHRHLGSCAECSRALTLERDMKTGMRAAGQRVVAPAELRAKLRQKYGTVRASPWERLRAWSLSGLRPVPGMSLLLLIFIPLAIVVTDARQAIPVKTLEIHRRVISGDAHFTRAESPDLLAQELSRAVGGQFAPPVYDMNAFGLHTAGGLLQRVRNRDVLVTLYEGNANALTCHAFIGNERDIPARARRVIDPVDGRQYFTFSDGLVNAVLQQSGDEICVLVSKLPMDQLLRVARSLQPTHRS